MILVTLFKRCVMSAENENRNIDENDEFVECGDEFVECDECDDECDDDDDDDECSF